jgi:hypothetical protein
MSKLSELDLKGGMGDRVKKSPLQVKVTVAARSVLEQVSSSPSIPQARIPFVD